MIVPWLFMIVPWLYHYCFMIVQWLYRDCFTIVPWLYHDCFNFVTLSLTNLNSKATLHVTRIALIAFCFFFSLHTYSYNMRSWLALSLYFLLLWIVLRCVHWSNSVVYDWIWCCIVALSWAESGVEPCLHADHVMRINLIIQFSTVRLWVLDITSMP